MLAILKKKKYFFIVPLVFCFCMNFASADNLQDAFKVTDTHRTDPLDMAAENAGYDIAIAKTKIEPIIAQIIQIALSLIGVIFLVLMIFAGYLWMTASGNEEQVTKAKDLIKASVIGLIIVVSAYAVTYFIVEALSRQTLQV